MGPDQKLAIITGASAGLGAVYAQKLAARGYDLIMTARRADRLNQLKAQLEAAHHVQIETVTADLGDSAQCQQFATRLEQLPAVDLLVNNAGFGTLGLFWETDYAQQEAMHRLAQSSEREHAGTTSLGALLRAKLDSGADKP